MTQQQTAPKAPSPQKVKRNSVKKRRILISLIVMFALLAALGGGLAVLWQSYGPQIQRAMGWVELDYEGEGTGEVIVTVQSGETGYDIAHTLALHDVVKTAEGFTNYLLEEAPNAEFHPGTFQMRAQMSPEAALAALQDDENRMEMTAMIPEGKTAVQTLEILSSATNIPLEELTAAAQHPQDFGVPENVPSLEGWLFPATYQFEPGVTAEQAIQRLVTESIAVLDSLGVPEADRERVLTIASIVQREARQAQDFGKVSQVIQNRLEQDMRLEMDSTSQYGSNQDNGSVWSTDEALADTNLWNTYVHTGLPAGPIANPGAAAIEATLNPTPGDWVYFVAVNLDTGETLFNTTLQDHERDVAKLTAWCTANPGRGC